MTFKRTEPHKSISLTLPVALLDMIDVEAMKQERNRTTVIRRALVAYLDEKAAEWKTGGLDPRCSSDGDGV